MSVIKFTATDGTSFVAKDDDGSRDCEGCEFDRTRTVAGVSCFDAPECEAIRRPDGRSIIWIKETAE